MCRITLHTPSFTRPLRGIGPAVLASFVLTGCSRTVSTQTHVDYAVDAKGRPAIVESATTITWPLGEYSGLILNAELCGDRAYLFAPSVKTVRTADLATGEIVGSIGRPGNKPSELRRPVTIGVDCPSDRLYVIEGPGGVLAFDLSGRYVETYPTPYELKPTMGAKTALVRNPSRLIVPGLWPAEKNGFDKQPRERMYADTNLGFGLPLDRQAGATIAPALERGCLADSTVCLRVDIQSLSWDSWLVAQGASTRVGIVSNDGALRRTFDIWSPLFTRDGSAAGRQVEDQMKWGETNSTIWGLYVVGDTIAVVHARNATKNWQRGQIMQFDVFMNLYSRDGKGLVSDIRLPDLPVGHDGTHVLVIDYGPAGRNPDVSKVRLLRIPVRSGTDGFEHTAAPPARTAPAATGTQ